MRAITLAMTLLCAVAACGDSSDDDNVQDAAVGGVDADPAAGPDAAPNAPDAPNSSGIDEVFCGESTCAAPDICCVTSAGMDIMATCTAANACAGSTVSCDGPEDCSDGGNICCGTLTGDTGSTDCAPAAGCMAVICHDTGDCLNPGETCCDFGIGSSFCAAICPGG